MINKLKTKLRSVDKGTIIRSIMLVAAIGNQIVAIIGSTTFAAAPWYQILSMAITAVVSIVAAWENNDWTYFARLGTEVLNALEDGKLTKEEVQELLDKANSKKE